MEEDEGVETEEDERRRRRKEVQAFQKKAKR